MEPIKDWRGTLIEKGDIILYSVKHSCSVEVNQAIVTDAGYKAPAWLAEFRDITDKDKKPFVLADWVQSNDGPQSNDNRQIRKVTLQVIGNITVVEKHQNEAWSFPTAPIKWR
ncbi:MAG: hypothetical protein ACREHG_05875 [Candidatus Saccharimonadales bacterium]